MKNATLDTIDDDTTERVKTQAAGLKWLYEMELLNSPQLINNLKLNIFVQDKSIKDVELLIDQNNNGILIYIKLSWIGKLFKHAKISSKVGDLITHLLPSYRNRVIIDKKIFNMALNLAAQQVLGGVNESNSKEHNSINSNNTTMDHNGKSRDSGLRSTPNLLSDQEEQKIDEAQTDDEVEQSDLQSNEKV